MLVEGLLLLGAAASLGASWGMGQAIDYAGQRGEPIWIVLAAVGYGLLVLGSAVLTWVARVRIERVAQAAMMQVKERLFAHLLRHDIALHDRMGSGALLARVSGDVEAMRLLFSEVILQLPGDVALVIGMFTVLGYTAPRLMALVAATVPIWIALVVWYRRVSPAAFATVRKESTSLSGWIAESVAAIPLLRTMDRLDFAGAHTAALGQRRFAADLHYGLQSVWFFNGLFGVRAALLAAVVWVGAGEVARGEISAGVLLVAVDYVRKMVEPFLRLQFHITTLERARVGSGRVRELLDTAPQVVDRPGAVSWTGPGHGLRFEAVDFEYVSGSPIFKGMDLWVPPGSHVAIVGPTGGGKSSIIQLLARFRDPTGGRVTLGGTDLRDLRLVDLRRHVGLVTQAVQLLPGTVAENLGAEPERAAALLRDLGLDGRLTPETRVGAGGEVLSRGEVQLLCVARALVHEPEILLLDEATSAMDPQTEARVLALRSARRGRTVVTVAHRLRTIADADRILVIDRGVIESGTHAELLHRGGVYAGLWRAQLARDGAAHAESAVLAAGPA